MFMEPFTGSISGPLQGIALGSAQALSNGSLALGSSEETATTIESFLYMPGWFVAALFSNLGL